MTADVLYTLCTVPDPWGYAPQCGDLVFGKGKILFCVDKNLTIHPPHDTLIFTLYASHCVVIYLCPNI